MSVRIYDLIATNPGQEFSDKAILTKPNIQLYNPSNLGGGYTRDESGKFSLNNESLSFSFVFKTDVNSTGYEKYLETVRQVSTKKLVWLRYAVPINGTQYTYAYRPGYISNISKTEAHYSDLSLVEQVTIQTLGGWFNLYNFTPSNAARGLSINNASSTNTTAVFSNYPDDFKVIPYAYPYWYKSIVEEVLKKRENGSNLKYGTWYAKWGNVLDPNSLVYTMFAIHAPNVSITETEMLALGQYENEFKTNVQTNIQINRMKGNSYSSQDYAKEDPELASDVQSSYKALQNSLSNKGKRAHNFKASIANYSVSTTEFFNGEYDSYLLIGYVTAPGGKIVTSSGVSGAVTSELVFNTTGNVIIDTAPWANIYSLNESSMGINFSKFYKTTANSNDKLTTKNVTLSRIIMRRGIIGV